MGYKDIANPSCPELQHQSASSKDGSRNCQSHDRKTGSPAGRELTGIYKQRSPLRDRSNNLRSLYNHASLGPRFARSTFPGYRGRL